jgi:hypothetical protein
MSRRRWWIWWPLLGVAAWLAFFTDPAPQAAAVSLPTKPSAPRASLTPVASEALPALTPRTLLYPPDAGAHPRDLFTARTWKAPATQSLPPAAPAEPVAPTLPYTFIGKKLDAGQWEVYLARGEQSFVARPGQTIEGMYRVEKIAPPLLTLTYLPLGQAQTLQIGDMP